MHLPAATILSTLTLALQVLAIPMMMTPFTADPYEPWTKCQKQHSMQECFKKLGPMPIIARDQNAQTDPSHFDSTEYNNCMAKAGQDFDKWTACENRFGFPPISDSAYTQGAHGYPPTQPLRHMKSKLGKEARDVAGKEQNNNLNEHYNCVNNAWPDMNKAMDCDLKYPVQPHIHRRGDMPGNLYLSGATGVDQKCWNQQMKDFSVEEKIQHCSAHHNQRRVVMQPPVAGQNPSALQQQEDAASAREQDCWKKHMGQKAALKCVGPAIA